MSVNFIVCWWCECRGWHIVNLFSSGVNVVTFFKSTAGRCASSCILCLSFFWKENLSLECKNH
jgi:hypothetical protein